MSGTDASMPGSQPTPPEDLRARLQRLRSRLDHLEDLLPDWRSRPLWHWYTQLEAHQDGRGSPPGADGVPTAPEVGVPTEAQGPGQPTEPEGSSAVDDDTVDNRPLDARPVSGAPWARIPPILERAPIALEDWTSSFGHRLWLERGRNLPPGPQAYRTPTRGSTGETPPRTVVGLPGIWEDWRHFHLWAQVLHDAGWDVHLLEELGDMTSPIPDLALRVREYLQLHDLHDVVLVAHSKGGLVGKSVMLGPEGSRVRGLIACATPFAGAPITRLFPTTELAELSPGSPTITELAGEDAVNCRIIQVEATWDQSVPPSPLTGVRHVTLPIRGHSSMLYSTEVARTLTVLARQLFDEGGATRPVVSHR